MLRQFFAPALAIYGLAILAGCSPSQESQMPEKPIAEQQRMKQLSILTPQANQIPFTAQYHGRTITDHFNWLKDAGYPEVNDQPIIDYLTQENAYFNAFLAPKKKLVDTLFEEYKGRTNDTESSVPWIENG